MNNLKGLYPIVDAKYIEKGKITTVAEDALIAGVKIIQYRDKLNNKDRRYRIAETLKNLTSNHHAILIINDDVELAASINADGIHVGQDDCTIQEAMNILGPEKIIGASCYNDFEKAIHAQLMGASYIAFGSFFNSPTKPNAIRASIDLVKHAKKVLEIPICAIGGINKENMIPLIKSGVDMIAVISAIFSKPSPKVEIKNYLARLEEFDLIA